jgi:hypothetical protein
VYKVAVAYIVAGWALSQGIAQVFPVFDIPNWAIRMIVLLIVVGFPVAAGFAWFFDEAGWIVIPSVPNLPSIAVSMISAEAHSLAVGGQSEPTFCVKRNVKRGRSEAGST